MNTVCRFVGIITLLVMFPVIVSAAIIRVPADQATIQAGIDVAVDGDTVLVADGTYTGDGNKMIRFNGKAITLKSESGPKNCIIDCMNYQQAFIFDCDEKQTSILDGFTITNGSRQGSFIRAGAIYCNSSPRIERCVIVNNFAYEAYGGGVNCEGGSALCMVDCIIMDNRSDIVSGGSGHGGGICIKDSSPVLTGCLIAENKAYEGGGIYCFHSSPLLLNVTLAKNESGGYAEIDGDENSSPVIINSIILGEISINCMASYCDFAAEYEGIGNIWTNPMFIGGDPFDYHLSPNSPCVDAGTDDGAPTTDIEGNPRPQGGAVDMGAYEYTSWPQVNRTYVKMPAHTFTTGDTASCSVTVWNAGNSTLAGHPLFTILYVMGNLYFAPSFTSYDYFKWSFPAGLTELTVIPDFTWPNNAGSASDIVWYTFLMNPEMTALASEIGVFDFGWGE